MKRRVAPLVVTDDQVTRAVDTALSTYRCQHTTDEDGDGLLLVDALTPPTEGTITLGVRERDLLAEHIINALGVPPSDQMVRDVDAVTTGLDKLVTALKSAPGNRTDNTAVHEAIARLRAAFGLDEGSDDATPPAT